MNMGFRKKPWGYEELIHVSEEYVIKRLHIDAGARTSLQKHEKKVETMILVQGIAQLTLRGVTTRMMPLYPQHIRPGEVHRLHAITPCVIVEVSSSELEDVIRLEDDFGRA